MTRWTKIELLKHIELSCKTLGLNYDKNWQYLPYNDLSKINNRLDSQIRHNNGEYLGV